MNKKSDHTIFLKGYQFNSIDEVQIPVGLAKTSDANIQASIQANIHADMDANEREDYHIVRFTGPIQEEWKTELENLGATLYDYIPDYAFIVKMTDEVKKNAENQEFVHEILDHHPAFKLHPALFNENGVHATKDNKSEGQFFLSMYEEDAKDLEEMVKNTGGHIVDKAHHLLKVHIDRSCLATLAQLPTVRHIEEVPVYELYNDVAKKIIAADRVWALPVNGCDGTGETVGIADTGLDTGLNDVTMHRDFQGRIKQIYALGRSNTANDPDGHGTHVAGSVVGNGACSNGFIKGMAPGAQLVFQSLLDANGGFGGLPSDLNALFQQVYDSPNDARIHSNSWGVKSNDYFMASEQVDQFIYTHRDMTVLFAAGNSGPAGNTICAPGTAKNCITVGASENERIEKGSLAVDPKQIAPFSSRGTCSDGRFKPDIVAPGTWIRSTKSTLAPDAKFAGLSGPSYAFMHGTSMATPIAAGCVALVRQFLKKIDKNINPTAALIKALLIQGATFIEYGAPSVNQGWGLINSLRSLCNPDSYFVVNETEEVGTGEIRTFPFAVNSPNTILKVTLCWTDYPGAPLAGKALVNDLDLIVIDPTGKEYFGNDFTAPYNLNVDKTNNVEMVYMVNPLMGNNWKIVVKGSNVPKGGKQKFALVAGQG